MGLSLARATVAGNLTRDVELKEAGASTVANISVAVNRSWKKADGTRDEKVSFIDVTVWNQQAEFVAKYFSKGSAILIEGDMESQSWKDKEGNDRSKIIVKAREVHFVDSKASGGGDTGGQSQVGPAAASAPVARSVTAEPLDDSDGVPF